MRPTLRLAAALGLLAVSCSLGSSASGGASSSARSAASPSAPVSSQAADLRTRLDVLLAEQVVIVAKETAAAAAHDDDYAGYTGLLTSNLTDLDAIVRTAFGDTAGDGFARVWSAQNGYLVDYGIGVVTHNDAKAAAATSSINGTGVPRLAAQVADMSGLSQDSIANLLEQQAAGDKSFIDDLVAQRYTNFQSDLQTAYFASARLGDALAARIAQRFSDRYPGDPTLPAVDRRVSLTLLLQLHAYVATMATDAVAGNRTPDETAAVAALGLNESAISRSLNDVFGAAAAADFDRAWTARDSDLIAYAQKGDAASRQALVATATAVATAAHAPPAAVASELSALIKVVDDQRSKAATAIAGDDRAAATSMQPVAAAIVMPG